jgi:predicted phosphoribosyltransferase
VPESEIRRTRGLTGLRQRLGEPNIVAVPTAPEETVKRLLPTVDEIYVLNMKTSYPFAVAEAYQNWYDLRDEEVISLLEVKEE